MSKKNEALVRTAHEAYGRGDVTTLLELVHPGLEWTYLDPGLESPQPQICHAREPGDTMRLQILHVPDCPGAEALDSRLAPLLAIRPDIQVTRQVVKTDDNARRLGMTGSPTILVNGADLFARPGQQPSLSCRLYLDEHGHPGPAPTTAQLREALQPDTTWCTSRPEALPQHSALPGLAAMASRASPCHQMPPADVQDGGQRTVR